MATITNRIPLTFLAPMNLKSSHLKKPASVCFSKLGSSIVSRLAVATSSSSFNKHLFADGLPRSARRNLGRVRAYARDEEEEERPTATWHYQLFSVLKLLINWCFRLYFFVVFIWFATLWLIMLLAR